MLTGMQIAFIGGDARQLEIIRKCVELDAMVDLIGYENLGTPIPGTMREELLPEMLAKYEAVILPVSGVSNQGEVESLFALKPLELREEHFSRMKKARIFSGITTPYLTAMCGQYQIPLTLLMERDDVAIYNSIPTVEGALMIAIQNTDFTIHHSHVIVLGFGRVGFSLARALHSLGAHVKVGVRKSGDMARIFEMGMIPFSIYELKDQVSNIDILFNTIPHIVVTPEVITRLKPTALIIDLASKPGGVDFRFAEKRGIKAILALGLPGIVAPKTAGKILANTVTRLLLESKGDQEGVE
ncbi:spore dipicolinate synthase subunit A [[Clostridium] ultunense Esp]|uniref:dipicolinate synthase subunit DpsA n=1 Tax=Thermicanus aegyptius TaxID=94009 RepID=UPI0002B701C2|nr:dipicolinate synthase subunit DpsA [Thermicanus aegyptius]CCQ98089.1 spore dipicolinate synthase subunit A [[Clostridium] ultunense Esp]